MQNSKHFLAILPCIFINKRIWSKHCLVRAQMFPTFVRQVNNNLWPISDQHYKIVNMLENCLEYASAEVECVFHVSGAISGDTSLRKHIVSLENSIIDTACGGLATTVLYMASFLVTKKWVQILIFLSYVSFIKRHIYIISTFCNVGCFLRPFIHLVVTNILPNLGFT